MYNSRSLTVTLSVLVLGACAPIPHTSEVAPRLSGAVRDARSGSPVAGAELLYTFADYYDRSISDGSGRFTIGPLLQWHYLLYLGSPGSYPTPAWLVYGATEANLTVTAAGYQQSTIHIPRHPRADPLRGRASPQTES
jgi:hypothetical protein